jgi:hypothetical protein
MGRWYPGRSGLGLVAGAVSGFTEAWDFDDRPTYEEFLRAAAASDLSEVITRIERGYCDETPGGGVRWLVRYPPELERGTNTKLARRPKRPDEQTHPNDKVKTLVELPDYAILAPTNGRVHPSGGVYRRRSGDFSSIATISGPERDGLIELARSFDQMPRKRPFEPSESSTSQRGNRPGDDFNRRITWAEILQPEGWDFVYQDGGTDYWRRPGKLFGISASTNFGGADLLYVFSTSTVFDAECGYSKFAAYTVLQCSGDFDLAARRLRERGYGPKESDLPDSWRLLDDAHLDVLPVPEFLIDGVLQRHTSAVIYGPSGSGKTTLVASLTTALAIGSDWFGHRVLRRGSSVYVAAEDPSGFRVRLTACKRVGNLPLDEPIGVHTFPQSINLRDPVVVKQFHHFLAAAQFAPPLECIVVDSYAAAMAGANENSSEDTTVAMAHAQLWRDALDVTVILIHHPNASGDRERGHSAMRSAVDTMISVTTTDDLIHVECSKQRNGPAFEPIPLRLVPVNEGGCVLRLAGDIPSPLNLTAAQEKALRMLRDTFGAMGATKSEWQRACQDVKERTFHRAAKLLVELGFVKRTRGRFYPSPKENK